MRAILQHGYGDPERVLLPGELERPVPGDGEVLVRLRATSINTPDVLATSGTPYVLRPLMGLAGPVSPVRGSDVAGVVEAVGTGVTDLVPGDEVLGSVWTGGFQRGAPGTFCAYTVAPARQLTKKPTGLSFEEAAGAVMSGVTALQAVRDVGRVRDGSRVLVHGASGGVGTFAVQIAKALGATVTAVCSARNVELVRSLGADHVIDYARADYTQGEGRYDVLLDNVMNHPLAASARMLAPGGLLVPNSIGGDRWVGSLPAMAFAGIFRARAWPTVQFRPSREHLDDLVAMLVSGAVRVVVDHIYDLDDAGKAVAHMASRRARGKIVLRMPRSA